MGDTDSSSNSNSSSKWSKHVPDDIMQPILQRLCIFDYVRCRSVCRSWRESIDRAIASRWCRPAPQLPWLLFRQSEFLFCRSKFSFRLSKFSFKRQHFIKLSLPNDDEHDDYVGSIEGWLMRVDWTGSIITLLNPISGGRVMLPRCKHEITAPFINKVVASSVPTTSSPSSLVVVCLSTNVERTNLAFRRPTNYTTTLAVCRPTDKSWTRIEEGLRFEDIEFIDGKLYAATNNPSESLIVFKFDTHNHDDQQQQQIQYRAERLVVLDDSRPDRVRFEHICRLFLAKDFSASTELLMITFPDNFLEEKLLLCPHDYAEDFQVFKLAFNNNAAANNGRPPPPLRWVEIVGFRDRILFLFQKCMEYLDTINVDTDDLLNIDLVYGIHTCLNLLRQRAIWLTPNPW
ncbi:Protein of unknown function D [Prunus dulcis]|uniref:F-box domain-containing protein n=1 Tax=Prunus dulcis TaxID=3755 RepID=A0A4Y1QKE8_PRUDU|nr:Protein of unknown function D [Prunus dulcis]